MQTCRQRLRAGGRAQRRLQAGDKHVRWRFNGEALRRAGVAGMPFRRKGGLACVLTLGATLSIGYFMPNS